MKYKYEFEMPKTPFESNCRVCPFAIVDDGYTWCAVQDDAGVSHTAYQHEKILFEKFMEMNMGCPLKEVKDV